MASSTIKTPENPLPKTTFATSDQLASTPANITKKPFKPTIINETSHGSHTFESVFSHQTLKPSQNINTFMGGLVFQTNIKEIDEKWSGFQQRLNHEQQQTDICASMSHADQCRFNKTRMEHLLARYQNAKTWKKLDGINRDINRIFSYRTDNEIHDKHDHWATPAEIFSSRGIDCEDYALLKLISLEKLGFAHEDMRIVIIEDQTHKQQHAVLSIKLPEGTYILDSLTNRISRHDQLPHYRSRYAVNNTGQWAYATLRHKF